MSTSSGDLVPPSRRTLRPLRGATSLLVSVLATSWEVLGLVVRSLLTPSSGRLHALSLSLSALGALVGSLSTWLLFSSAALSVLLLGALVGVLYVLVTVSCVTGTGLVLDRRRDRRLLEGAGGVRVRLRDARLVRLEEVRGGIRIDVSHSGVETEVLDDDARPVASPENGLTLSSPSSFVVLVSASDVIDARVAELSGAPGSVELYGTLARKAEGEGFVFSREQLLVEFPSWSGSFA